MKIERTPISYWELSWCVVVITGTFQLVIYFLSFNDFMDDSYGLIRFMLFGILIGWNYRSILFYQIFKTFKSIIGLITIYLVVTLLLVQFIRLVDQNSIGDYILFKVEKEMESSRSEMASKGFAIDAAETKGVVTDSVIFNLSFNRLVQIFSFKMLFFIFLSFIIAYINNKPIEIGKMR